MIIDKFSELAGRALARYLTAELRDYRRFSIHRLETLETVLVPGDVILVEGDLRVSTAIKYLTQSNWSHAAMYIGRLSEDISASEDEKRGHAELSGLQLIEADLEQGVIVVPLEKYSGFNLRICRPYNLEERDKEVLVQYMVDALGMQYDLKNIADLARYLLPKPPVPKKWKRKMLALGSADPTRAICSSLIAQAFHSIDYPILPDVFDCGTDNSRDEVLHIRHHSLFAPKDFDVSPYFEIIKPELMQGFDYKNINWHHHSEDFLATGETDFDCKLEIKSIK